MLRTRSSAILSMSLSIFSAWSCTSARCFHAAFSLFLHLLILSWISCVIFFRLPLRTSVSSFKGIISWNPPKTHCQSDLIQLITVKLKCLLCCQKTTTNYETSLTTLIHMWAFYLRVTSLAELLSTVLTNLIYNMLSVFRTSLYFISLCCQIVFYWK